MLDRVARVVGSAQNYGALVKVVLHFSEAQPSFMHELVTKRLDLLSVLVSVKHVGALSQDAAGQHKPWCFENVLHRML